MIKIRPVILSGGSGTRLWPLSRKDYPKQFTRLFGEYSLLLHAFDLIDSSNLFVAPLLIGNENHKFFLLDACTRQKNLNATILLEPVGRNTGAAAITTALSEQEENILHLMMPSDHLIREPQAFCAAIRKASQAAQEGAIVAFGIEPEYAETGYGYILPQEQSKDSAVHKIRLFKEKPDSETAQGLIEEGALWNSGIFLYDPKSLLSEARKCAPDYVRLCEASLRNASYDLGCTVLPDLYRQINSISFDHLIMEKTHKAAVVPCAMSWSDIGSWQALWQVGDKDENGNVKRGDCTTLDVKDCYLHSEGATLGVIGIENLAVIATKDAILVAPITRSQDVRTLVALLEKKGIPATAAQKYQMRPWGSHEVMAHENLENGARFQVKHIIVKPSQSLSLQMHQHRTEHWVVVAGTATVECDGKIMRLYENESIFVPRGARHRLSNHGKMDLHVVEVASGDYLGEDDIVRFEDDYGRHKPRIIKFA